MWAPCVKERQVVRNPDPGRCHRFVGMQVHLFVFYGAPVAGLGPQAFYEDVIDPAALTIHTNVDIVVFDLVKVSLTA